jgi:hypothetical protein
MKRKKKDKVAQMESQTKFIVGVVGKGVAVSNAPNASQEETSQRVRRSEMGYDGL